MQLKQSRTITFIMMLLFIVSISFSVSSCSKNSSSKSGTLSFEELLKSTEIDISKIPTTPKVKSEVEKIVESYNTDSHKLAVEVDSLINRFPESFLLRAVKLQFLSQMNEAGLFRYVNESYAKDSTNILNQYFYALVRKDVDSEKIFKDIIAKNPESNLGYLGLSQALLEKKPEDLTDVAKLAYIGILKEPTKDEGFYLLSYLFDVMQDFEKKAMLNGIMLTINPSNSSAFNSLLHYYLNESKKEKAFDLLEVFIKNNPKTLTNTDIAYYYSTLDKFERTLKYVNKGFEMKEPIVFLNYLSAKANVALGNLDEGFKFLKEFKKTNPQNTINFFTDPVFTENLYNNKEYTKMLKEIEPGAITIGDKAIEFTGKYLDGTDYDSELLKGKVYLIDFWAEWCMPCKQEMPNVIEVYNSLNKEGFEIIGINLDKAVDAPKKYIADKKMNWKHIYSGDAWNDANVTRYKVTGIPATYLVDKKGIIRYKSIRGKELLSSKVKKLLAE